MIKNLLLLPCVLFLLSSCKYGSSIEAQKSCSEWKAKGGFFYVGTYTDQFGTRPSSRNIRSCRWDKLTNQYLGYEYTKVKKNQKIDPKAFYNKKDKQVVVKRFKY